MNTRTLILVASVVILLTALSAVALPLLVYTVSLAAFGLPHVLTELRYVDARFHRRVGRGLWLVLGFLVMAVVGVRILAIQGGVSRDSGMAIELLLVIALAVTTLPVLMRSGPLRAGVGFLLVVLLGLGVAMAPAFALVTLAFLHNLTPIGFLAEALRGAARRKAMIFCGVAFLAVPAFIMTGLPYEWLASRGWVSPEATLLPAGGLDLHMHVFVPAILRDSAVAFHLFCAAVYLQCMHYAVVIHVLPRLLSRDEQKPAPTALPWSRGRAFGMVVATVGAVFFVGFCLSFGDARTVYGLFAAVHAWIEVPVLLLALAIPQARLVPAAA